MPALISLQVAFTPLQVKGGKLRNILTQHPGVDQLNYCSSSAEVEWRTFLLQAAAVDVHEPRNNGAAFFEHLNKKLEGSSNPLDTVDPNDHSFPPFTTGWLGHLNYEAAGWIEPSLVLHPSEMDIPIGCFRKYEASIAWHISTDTMWVFGRSQAAIGAYLKEVDAILQAVENATAPLDFTQKTTDSNSLQFQTQVAKIKQQILAGDIFQANLTRMLSIDLGDTSRAQLAGFSKRLLTQSEAPFGAILNFENTMVVSASPERFFRIEPSVEGRKIFAEPIKGTRPRHEDPELDEALKQDLVNSEKDRAENIMIADLVRNDLSRVCKDESIVADPICELRSFKNVHHLVTRVSGILRDDVSNLDALLAQFPCGSITGAPKWAAMDAIAELEQRGRGIYCGTIGYFDDRGHADFSVAIRTAVASFVPERSEQSRSAFMQDGSDISKDNGNLTGTTLTYGTGGGITILSDPEEEFTETEDKAVGFLRALQL